MNWQILILAHVFIVSISLLAVRAIARQKNLAGASMAVNALNYSFLYLLGLLCLPLLPAVQASDFWRYWPWFLGGGIAFAMTNIFYYKVVSHLDAGIAAVLGTMGSLFTIILAGLVLHEELSVSQAVGGFIIFSAVFYILTVARQPGKHRRYSKSWILGLGFAFIGSLFFALAMVNEKFLLSHINSSTYVVFGWGAQTTVSFILALAFQRSQFKLIFKPKILRLIAIGGITRGVSGLIFVLALIKSDNVALLTATANFKLIIIVLLGAWLLNEKQKITEKLTAAFLALAGLSVILWK